MRWTLRRVFVTSLGAKSHTDNVVVRARLSGGAAGYGEASSSLAMASQTAPKMAAALRRLFRAHEGADARDMERLVRGAWRQEPGLPTAVAAFETALWDALARAEGIPFFRLWGGARRRLETLMSVSAVPPADVFSLVRKGTRQGFRAFKLKLNGHETPCLDRERIRQARRAAPRGRLLADANQSYGPDRLEELLGQSRQDGVGLELVEEPFRKKDWKTLASFRGKVSVPLLLDESVQTPADARRARTGRLAQGINIKLAKSGLLGSEAVLEAFSGRSPRAGEKPLMIGCMAESALGLTASVHYACGKGVFDHADLDSDLFVQGPAGGYARKGPEVSLPKQPPPGLGVHWPPARRARA